MFKDLKISGFDFSQDEKGNWLWKSEQTPFKKNGTLKAEYKDMPRLPAIMEIEQSWLKDFEKTINEGLKTGLKKLWNT